ncbi:hypothetical protein HCU64_06600 [Methylobacterium sp. C25]|uniref:HNH endonuclease n=1 Tax=Methylobacterium sp. C25 TaxID=2721622 RepID=UPI001F1A0A14|nr:HNH endonuclease [Methylobacterium sp. C25]MCE4223416.1 hypothetical protein [Methylobacterium sp. C25]
MLERIEEYKVIKKKAFLQKYARGVGAKSHYVLYDNNFYDLKAIYAASCNPPAAPSEKTTRDSRTILEGLGFVCVSDVDESSSEYTEGGRKWSEVQIITRNKGLVSAAKEKYKTICRACGFNFEKFYGKIGIGFIECHHLNPVAKGLAQPKVVTVEEVTVLCSNCHRMVHTSDPPLTVEALQERISEAQNSK